jgi:Holliday junction resolvasome RuvABC endonuclease subunit
MKTTMGLDLSLSGTGVVVKRGEAVLHRSLISTEPAMGSHHARMTLIACTIAEIAREYEPDLVGIEGYAFGKQFNTQPLMELGGVVKHYLFHEECPWVTYPPQSLKKFALGAVPSRSGYSKAAYTKYVKGLMVDAARAGGCETFDDNVADAYHMATWAQESWRNVISEALETVA